MQGSETVVSTLSFADDRQLNSNPVKKSHGAICVWTMGVETFVEYGVSLKTAAQVGMNALVYHGTNFTDTSIMPKSR